MSLPKISNIHQKVMDRSALNKGVSNNHFWDDANKHYEMSIQAVEKAEGALTEVLDEIVKDPSKLALIKDQSGLANNVTVLTKDLEEHIHRLNQIHSKHSHRKGGTCTPDDQMEVLKINGEYTDALEIYEANIVPVVNHILEQIGASEEIVNATKSIESIAQAQVQDVSVVTDLPFRDVSKV